MEQHLLEVAAAEDVQRTVETKSTSPAPTQRLTRTGVPSLSIGAVLTYFICSSMMLVLNKLALSRFPFPLSVTMLQTFSSVVLLQFLRLVGFINVPPMTLKTLLAWRGVAVVFVMPLIFNMQAMAHVCMLVVCIHVNF